MVFVVHNTFSAIWFAESPPCGNCCRLGWPYDLIVFCLFLFFFYLFSFFESRSGLVSFQADHSIWCVHVALLTKNLNLISKYCLGTYDNLPAQYTTILHVKMLISHDNMKYFLPILLKQ